jgi:hypothetical protein
VSAVDKHFQKRVEFSQLLLEEARPFMTAEPRVWARQVGEAVTFGEIFGRALKSQLPFGKTTVRTDVMVFHDIPTPHGLLHVVQNYGGAAIQPTDFLLIIDCSIPRAAYVKDDGLLSKWATALTDSGQKDDFKDFLDNIERGKGFKADNPLYHVQWTYAAGSAKVKLPYTMQLVPLGDGRCLYLFKNPFTPGLWSAKQIKFEVGEFMMLATWLKEALSAYAYAGPPAPLEMRFPTLSLLAIPELAGSIQVQGVELPWPASDKQYVASPPPAPAAPPPAPAAEPGPAVKYCIACGQKISGNARFCPKCGAKQ